MIILKWMLKWEGVDWIYFVHDRDYWRTLENMKKNLQVP
jgi:hypothetical protein